MVGVHASWHSTRFTMAHVTIACCCRGALPCSRALLARTCSLRPAIGVLRLKLASSRSVVPGAMAPGLAQLSGVSACRGLRKRRGRPARATKRARRVSRTRAIQRGARRRPAGVAARLRPHWGRTW
jgi:hypothetical protein